MRGSNDIQQFGVFQIIVLVLSLYAFAALLVDAFFPLSPHASRLIQLFDYVVCAVFFIDFVKQFRAAEDKLAYMKWGWIDLLASVPTIDFLRWARVFRVIRILRVIRAIRGTQKLWKFLRKREALGGSVALSAFMLIVIGSVAISLAEAGGEGGIQTAMDALWWCITTVTTVGYGDLYPVTPAGRVIAAVLMIGGVGLFGSLTAFVASWFTGRNEQPPTDTQLLLDELKALRVEVHALREQIGEVRRE